MKAVNYKRTLEFMQRVEYEGVEYTILHYDDYSDVGGELGEAIIQFEAAYNKIVEMIGHS